MIILVPKWVHQYISDILITDSIQMKVEQICYMGEMVLFEARDYRI